jgi:hypothetical protein
VPPRNREKILLRKGAFARHLLRFRHADHLSAPAVGGEVPELVLLNSHDGTSAYKFLTGIFRLVCSNPHFSPSCLGTVSPTRPSPSSP